MMPQMALAKDYYDADDKITLNDLMYGLMLKSRK